MCSTKTSEINSNYKEIILLYKKYQRKIVLVGNVYFFYLF